MGPLCFRQCLHFKNNTPVKICEGTEKRSAVLHLVTFITISRSSPSFCVGAAIFGGGHTFLWLSMIERTKGRIKLLQDIRYLLSLQLLKCSLDPDMQRLYNYLLDRDKKLCGITSSLRKYIPPKKRASQVPRGAS